MERESEVKSQLLTRNLHLPPPNKNTPVDKKVHFFQTTPSILS